MIKNDRQYRITKAQLRKFNNALQQPHGVSVPQKVDAILLKAHEAALESQREELLADIEEYEALQEGKVSTFTVDDFAELPSALIKARISLGLTQKDLAKRLDVKEQQVQRWEASDYAKAGIDTLVEVLKALGVETKELVFVPNIRLTADAFLSNLATAGVPRNLVINRLVPPDVAASFVTEAKVSAGLGELLRGASTVSRVFGVPVMDLMTLQRPALSFQALAAARFKLPVRTNMATINAYTVYAHYLAGLVESCAPSVPGHSLPTDYHEMHRCLTRPGKPMQFRETLEFLWDCGLIIFPLRDEGAFHGAVWKIRNRFVIVLKQTTSLDTRWLYDLLHETGHVARGHIDGEDAILEEQPISPNVHSEEEDEANDWAEDTLFDGNSDEIEQACVQVSTGKLQRLKPVVRDVAKRFNVNVGALANHMAYRLASEGKDWWGAAHNLQRGGSDPYDIARQVLLRRVNLLRLNVIDRDLLMRALMED